MDTLERIAITLIIIMAFTFIGAVLTMFCCKSISTILFCTGAGSFLVSIILLEIGEWIRYYKERR